MDTAVMIWDGNPIVGTAQIQKWYDELPSITVVLSALDSHPVCSKFA